MTDAPDNADREQEATEGTVIPPDHQSGEWLSPAEAAASLGISERTLWRHINAGRYHKRIAAGRAEVFIPGENGDVPDNPASASMTSVRRSTDSLTVTRLLDRLAEHIEQERALHDRIAALERENGRLASEATHAAEAARIERERRLEAERELERQRSRRWWDWLLGR